MSISIYIKKLILSLIFFSLYFSLASQQISIIDENNFVSILSKKLNSTETIIKEKDLCMMKPRTGIPANEIKNVIGKIALQNLVARMPIKKSQISDEK